MLYHPEVETALNDIRILVTPGFADVSEGMAELYEDRPSSPCIGVFTTVFCRAFCEQNKEYVWRSL